MKLIDILPFTLALVLFVIGIHQSMIYSIADSYWIFMLSLALLFLYSYRKGKLMKEREKEDNKQKRKRKKK